VIKEGKEYRISSRKAREPFYSLKKIEDGDTE
jgi:hypothetical protein